MRARKSFVLVLAVLAGCVSSGVAGKDSLDSATNQNPYLHVENMTIDVVRVYLELPDGYAVLLGRVDPMARAQLRIPRALSTNNGDGSIAMVPIGSPFERVPSPGSRTVRSDQYPITDLLQSGWRLSNSRVFMSLLPR
jgi:hypothetical protein